MAAGYDKAELHHEAPRTEDARTLLKTTLACAASLSAIVHHQTLTPLEDGSVLVGNRFAVDEAALDLPRLGVTLALPSGFETVSWFGRGPSESHVDRKAGNWVGRFESTVSEQYVPYIVPQEHGNKTDVRWIALENGDIGLRFECLQSTSSWMEASASHFTPHDLFAAMHTFDLQPREETWLNLDVMQRGVGTASCGPDALDCYRIAPGEYALSFLIRLYKPSVDGAE